LFKLSLHAGRRYVKNMGWKDAAIVGGEPITGIGSGAHSRDQRHSPWTGIPWSWNRFSFRMPNRSRKN